MKTVLILCASLVVLSGCASSKPPPPPEPKGKYMPVNPPTVRLSDLQIKWGEHEKHH